MSEKKKSSSTMTEAAKAARREYKRKWRESHREQIRQYDKEYWERKAARTVATE